MWEICESIFSVEQKNWLSLCVWFSFFFSLDWKRMYPVNKGRWECMRLLTGKAALLIYFWALSACGARRGRCWCCQAFITPVSTLTDVQALLCPSCGLLLRVLTGRHARAHTHAHTPRDVIYWLKRERAELRRLTALSESPHNSRMKTRLYLQTLQIFLGSLKHFLSSKSNSALNII